MKRKLTIMLFAIFCCCSYNARSQYDSFFANNTWEYREAAVTICYETDYSPENLGSCIETISVGYSKSYFDTINGKRYYKPISGWYHYAPYLREDSIEGKLYGYYDDFLYGEYLLCDMSLNEGDTFSIFPSVVHESDGIWVVDSVRSIHGKKNIFLSNKKIENTSLFFDGSFLQYNVTMRFIEGVGPTYGVCVTDYLNVKLCLHKDDTLNFMLHEDLQCYQEAAGLPTFGESSMKIFPNPATDKVNIAFERAEMLPGELYIMDISGRIFWQGSVNDNNMVLNIENFPSGLYTILYTNSIGKSAKKIVIK